ncbi:MAG: hypothetical protein EA381_15705 [Planctomycetaceae bacterium]|nr:MAG: hypothetical protein EA381_15705 [Planctomycetaceae bacterium]
MWLLAAAPIAFAEDSDSQVEEPYRPFQGAWKVVAPDQEAGPEAEIPEIFVDVVGKKFTLRGSAVAKDLRFPLEFRVPSGDEVKPYRSLANRGIQGIDHLVDIENQIVVFWYVGIYELKDDVLRLRLKYCGQGVGREAFRNFKPPSSFSTEIKEDEAYVVLQRVKG